MLFPGEVAEWLKAAVCYGPRLVSFLVPPSPNECRGFNLPDRPFYISVHVESSFPVRSTTSFATSRFYHQQQDYGGRRSPIPKRSRFCFEPVDPVPPP